MMDYVYRKKDYKMVEDVDGGVTSYENHLYEKKWGW